MDRHSFIFGKENEISTTHGMVPVGVVFDTFCNHKITNDFKIFGFYIYDLIDNLYTMESVITDCYKITFSSYDMKDLILYLHPDHNLQIFDSEYKKIEYIKVKNLEPGIVVASIYGGSKVEYVELLENYSMVKIQTVNNIPCIIVGGNLVFVNKEKIHKNDLFF